MASDTLRAVNDPAAGPPATPSFGRNRGATSPRPEDGVARSALLPGRSRPAARPAFVIRVLRMTVVLTVFVAWVLLSLGRFAQAGSFAIGAATGIGMLWVLRFAVGEALSGKRTGWKRKAFAGTLAVAKYGVLGFLIWWFVRQPWASAPAFAAGAAMTQVVLLLKALGTLLSPADKRDPYST